MIRGKRVSLDKIEKTSVQEVKQHLRDRALHPIVPPAHIVSGECSWEELNIYLMQHPIETLRAREVAAMYKWMQPLTTGAQMWGLGDILKPGDEKNQ